MATAAKKKKFEAGEIEINRFTVVGDGTVIDTKTGLMWAAEDSHHTNQSVSAYGDEWQHANIYCENYRGGGYSDWRMPTIPELKELYAAFVGKTTEELEKKFWSKNKAVNIEITKKQRDVPIWIYSAVWSREISDSSAIGFYFRDGQVFRSAQSYRYDYRALPVRLRG